MDEKKSRKRFETHEAIEAITLSGKIFEKLKIPYMLIGAHALVYLSLPRTTYDVDFMYRAPKSRVKSVNLEFEAKGFSGDETFSRLNPMLQYVTTRFIFRDNTVLDTIRASDAFERNAVKRRIKRKAGRRSIFYPTAEDMILMKLRAGRPHDLTDCIGIAKKNLAALNYRYLKEWALRLGLFEEAQYVIARAET